MADGADQKYWADGQPLEFLSSPDDTTGGEQKFWVDGQPIGYLAPATGAFTLTADTRSYSLVGIDANLLYPRTLTADTQSYAVTGIDAGLLPARKITADIQTYAVIGIDAGLVLGGPLLADTGIYTVSGQTVGLQSVRRMLADVGAYTFIGIDIGITAPPYYSAEGVSTLPTNRDTLAYIYSNADRTAVAADDASDVDINGDIAIHQFQVTSNSSTTLQLIWKGISTRNATANPITFELWNTSTNSWELAASDTTTAANTPVQFIVSKGASTANYIDANNRITARVWQGGIV